MPDDIRPKPKKDDLIIEFKDPPIQLGDKQFKCPFCNVQFDTYSRLQVHVEKKSGKQGHDRQKMEEMPESI